MGFRIDGSDYEIPEFDTFTMGEAMTLKRLSGLGLEDFALNEDDPVQAEALRRNILHPGVVLTRMVIAYQRGNPGTSIEAAQAIVENSNWLEAFLQYTERFKGDAGPLVNENSGPDESSESSSDPSGGTSVSASAKPGETPEPTGTSE